MTQKEAQNLFYYDRETGLLFNKIKRGPNIVPGTEAGTLTTIGKRKLPYKRFWYKEKLHLVHRVIWIFNNGEIPEGLYIDHIDGNGLNNRIENLRLVTPQENSMNRKISTNNTSGVIGVSWNKRVNQWQAGIMVHQCTINLGYFSSMEAAIHARQDADKKYGFHPNHGRH